MPNEEGSPSAIRENIKYLKRENTLKNIRRYALRSAGSSGCCVLTSKQLTQNKKKTSKVLHQVILSPLLVVAWCKLILT